MSFCFRKNDLLIVTVLSCSASMSFAEETSPLTSFAIEMPLLKYSSKEEKTKIDAAAETTAKTTAMHAVPLADAYLSATIRKKVVLYVYPFTDVKTFTLGYLWSDALEFGVDLGLDSVKVDKPKDEKSNNLYGAYVWYYLPVGSNTLEMFGIYDWANQKTSEMKEDASNNVIEEKSETTTISLKIGAQYVYSISKNFQYVGGISYNLVDAKEKETKTKTKGSEFSIKLASVRILF